MKPVPYLSDTILVIDDEPMYLEWLGDYLKAKGLKVEFAETADSGIQKSQAATYRAYIVDLNMPASDELKSDPKNRTSLDAEYPGLIVARHIRTAGESGSRVIVYSVYISDLLYGEVRRLGCTFVQKGRPKVIKEQIEQVLSKDPKKSS
ncbi:response regulator [Comamonas sp.]|uniref:response regulator n=1 Tax=Comamonas sp. TaxID=34028 RepID=UPI0012C9555F|nr:response regulator [Comamonas sp.]MPS94030.1 response regulator [Comamonas sp.]